MKISSSWIWNSYNQLQQYVIDSNLQSWYLKYPNIHILDSKFHVISEELLFLPVHFGWIAWVLLIASQDT